MSPEFSIVQFSISPDTDNTPILPVVAASDLAFFSADNAVAELGYYNAQGYRIANATSSQTSTTPAFIALSGDLGAVMAPGDQFRIGYKDAVNALQLSNLFAYTLEAREFAPRSDKYTSLLEYRCNETQYGFDYNNTEAFNSIRLPIRAHSPNPLTEQKVYTKFDGTKKVLYAKMDKQWELETEYFPETLHDKIIVALAHDVVRLNGVTVVASGDYAIDWPNGYQLEDGTWVAKATAKIQGNKTLRNSNC